MITINVTNMETVGDGDVKLYGRTESGEHDTITVTGFDPYFYAPALEYSKNKDELSADERVLNIEATDKTPQLGDDTLVKVVVDKPWEVSKVANQHFSDHFEADVWIDNRLRIDHGIYTGVKAPQREVTAEQLEPVTMEVEPRVVTFDIEVDERGLDFSNLGTNRILSIVAHDSQEDEYIGFIDSGGREVDEMFPDGCPDNLDTLFVDNGERPTLIRFASWIDEKNPDLITGWNSTGFDVPYLVERMERVCGTASRLSREGYAEVGDYGDVTIKGRTTYDLMDVYKKNRFSELRSYSLDFVAQEELGEEKITHDLGFYEMYEQDPTSLMEYNAMDVRLTVGINEETDAISFRDSIRQEIGTNFEETLNSSDFIEMMARRKLHENGLVGRTTDYGREESDYEGGYVFDPYDGVAKNVVGIDLASLYPNTMAMINAGPEARVESGGALMENGMTDLGTDPRGNTVTTRAAHAPNGAVFDLSEPTILTSLVNDALGLKAEYGKKKKEAPGGSAEEAALEERYNVSKTIVNSLYGVVGWEKFFMYDEATAEAVTLMGQAVIKRTAEYIEEDTEATVAYGDTDSVPAEEPVLVRDMNGNVQYREIQELVGREDEFEAWTEGGFTGIKKVWEKPNRKTNYTVRTKTGLVHCTEDHSLVHADGSEIKPGELTDGTRLLHRDVSEAIGDGEETISTDRAWLYGFFAADGSAGIVEKHGFSISKNNLDLLERASEILSSEFGINSKIHDYRESSGVHKLQLTNNGDVEWGGVNDAIDHFVDVSYTKSREKCVPSEVINGTEEIVEAFLDGYMGGDGYVGERYDKRFHEADTKDIHLASGLTMLLQRLGYTFNINYRRNYGNEYYKIRCQKWHRGNPEEVVKVEEYDYDGEYVYDIETENHHFQAGAGNMIVHNSNYIKFPDDYTQEKCLRRTSEICEELNNVVYPELAEEHGIPAEDNRWEIEIEKYFERFFQYGRKKRYAYKATWKEGMEQYSDTLDSPEYDMTGMNNQRSDVSLLTKDLEKDVVRAILDGKDKTTIGSIVHDYATEIDPVDPDWERIGIPGGFGQTWSEYDSETAHLRAARNANEILGTNFDGSSKPMRCYLQEGGKHDIDVIAYDNNEDLSEAESELRMNASRMSETAIINPMEGILDSAGIDVQAAMKGQLQSGLEAFM